MGTNFLKETKRAITDSGHMPEDIMFIGSEVSGHECSWEKFENLTDFEYDDGFGSSQIPSDLIIVFDDGKKLWRLEFHGSEWWEYSTPFSKLNKKKDIVRLKPKDGKYSVEDLNPY